MTDPGTDDTTLQAMAGESPTPKPAQSKGVSKPLLALVLVLAVAVVLVAIGIAWGVPGTSFRGLLRQISSTTSSGPGTSSTASNSPANVALPYSAADASPDQARQVNDALAQWLAASSYGLLAVT